MAKTPYLHRRGNNLYFRITVPTDIRPILGLREITRTLNTQHFNQAVPLALMLGARVLTIFNKVRYMSKDNADDVISALLELAALDALDEERQREIQRIFKEDVENSPNKGLTAQQAARHWVEKNKIREVLEDEREQRIQDRQHHLTELKHQQQIIDSVLNATRPHKGTHTAPAPRHKSAPLLLSNVIDRYLKAYPGKDLKDMPKKTKAALSAFLELVGDKKCDFLVQEDITDFFELIQQLPPNWQNIRNKGTPLKQIITVNEGKQGLSEGTFSRNYVIPLRQFLDLSSDRLSDFGFPSLKTDPKTIAIYHGDKKATGADKQRPIASSELKKLFEGDRMKRYAADKKLLHKFWLPHVGLYTGARINEICQLNPLADFVTIADVLCINFSEEGESDAEITKSIKTISSTRLVPVHSQLIKLGFAAYIEHLKSAGITRIFPEWAPRGGRASKNAERWFQRELEHVGIKDNTQRKKLVGFHAFRHTFINHAYENDINTKYIALTGHDDKTASDVVKGYRGSLSTMKLQSIMEQFKFDLDFIKPISPE